MSSTGHLLSTTLTVIGRRRRELFLVALPTLVSSLVSLALILYGADAVFDGQWAEVWNRVNSNELFPWRQEDWAYLESVDLNLVDWGLPMMIVGAIIYLATVCVHVAAVARICVLGLHERDCGVIEALRWGTGRVLRLAGLSAKILVLSLLPIVAVVAIIGLILAVTIVFNPAFVVLLIVAVASMLALVAALILTPGVLVVAFIVAAIGPAESSLLYAVRLVRASFWTTLGRAYLIALAALPVGVGADAMMSTSMPVPWQAVHLITGAAEVAMFTACVVASCVLYSDLGGDVSGVA